MDKLRSIGKQSGESMESVLHVLLLFKQEHMVMCADC